MLAVVAAFAVKEILNVGGSAAASSAPRLPASLPESVHTHTSTQILIWFNQGFM